MGRNKKTETAKSEEVVVVDVQVGEDGITSEPATEQEAQPSSEIEKIEEVSETKKSKTTKQDSAKDDPVEEISPREAELMRLYPQYEKIWITPNGFVHPEGVPEYLVKVAKLFKNKYFNK